LNLADTGLEICQIIIYSVYQTVLLLTQVLTDNIFLCLFEPCTVNNPILYAAIPTFWLVAIPGFLIISSVTRIMKVMSIVVPVAASGLKGIFSSPAEVTGIFGL